MAIVLITGCLTSQGAAKLAASHPVSVVEADVYVDKTRTTMKLTCFAEDLELLQGVEALESGVYDSEELVDAMQDHADYLAQRVQILDADGEPLTPKVTQIIDFEIPSNGIEAGQLMQYVMAFVIEYQTESPPDFLTIRQNMVAEGALLPSELKILLKQAGSDTPYTHMMKPGIPQTFRLDWDRPLLAPDADVKDWEDWFAEQREKTLGIDSYSSTYSFIYINDHEVRHEVLIPLATLAALIDFERADNSFLDVAEQEVAREQIKAWFSSGNPVTLNGETIQPNFDRIDFYGLDLRDFAIQAKARRVSMASGRVGVIMSHPAANPPKNVTVTWDMFNHAIRSVDSVIFAYDDTQTTAFSKFLADNTFEWSAIEVRDVAPIEPVLANIDDAWMVSTATKINVYWLFALLAVAIWPMKWLLKITWSRTAAASIVAAATAGVLWQVSVQQSTWSFDLPATGEPELSMPDEAGRAIFAKLHANLFRAFDYRKPSDVYDALAHTVEGPLLRELYLDINRSLKMQEQGGAVAKIENIETLTSEPSEKHNPLQTTSTEAATVSRGLTFGWRCEWNLSGTVEHWGHIHQRINQYDAQFDISDCNGVWKISRLQMTDNQGTVKTQLRKLESSDES